VSARTLHLTSPLTHGADVEGLQHDLNNQLHRWSVPHSITVDGEYGHETDQAVHQVCYGLGVDQAVLVHGVTPALRIKIRRRRLTVTERQRYTARADWRKRLAQRYARGAPAGVALALDFARTHLGVTEHPPGSNRGPEVDVWERACGVLAAPWCGCFANAALVAAGFPSTFWIRFCPSIEGNAKSGAFGWRWITAGHAEPGDLVLYGTPIAHHVGMVVTVEHGVDTATIEGNTSNGPGGSQSNGGIVARRHRHTDGSLAGFPIRGYARPPWGTVK
jgi:hypothetical protein